MKSFLLITFAILAGLFLLATVLICLYLYPKVNLKSRAKTNLDDYSSNNLSPEKIRFKTQDGIPSIGLFYKSSGEKRPIVILLHGYAYHMGTSHERTSRLLDLGFHVFEFDFRGCGESSHSITTIGMKETGEVIGALRYLKTRDDVDLENVALWGGSMGAAVALRSMKLVHGLKAVISDSSFYDIGSVFELKLKQKNLPGILKYHIVLGLSILTDGNQFKNSPANDIRDIKSIPVLFIHGDRDIDIDMSDTVRLHELYQGPKELMILEGYGHNAHNDIPEYVEKCFEFLSENLPDI